MKNFVLVIVVVLLALVYGSIFVVDEGTRAISVQFGKVKRDADNNDTIVYGPGIHLKLPLLIKLRSWMRVFKPWMMNLGDYHIRRRFDC